MIAVARHEVWNALSESRKFGYKRLGVAAVCWQTSAKVRLPLLW
ncbi:hypothetical protein [Thiomicrorhabdus xiamenensis]|nr:hypothetical protein [Thiomicrorhabdus xiamenensis]